MFYDKLSKWLSADIGIDLGTANCLVYERYRGIIIDEPSVVAVKTSTHEVMAVGRKAKEMLGKTPPDLKAVRPMKNGAIADFDVAEEMLRYFIQKAILFLPWQQRILRPSVLVAVPSGLTEVENRAVKDSAHRAGAGWVKLIAEPMASAMGVGLPVDEPVGSMIVDIGGGTTEVAILSLSGIVCSKSVRVGGDEFNDAISKYMKNRYNLTIGELTAEEIKFRIGSAAPVKDDEQLEVRGLDLGLRVPKTIRVSGLEIREALAEPIASITEAVRATLERCPPDLAADLLDRGIMLAGGGALLSGMDQLLSDKIGLPVFVSEEPLQAVVRGTGVILESDCMHQRD